MFYGGDKEAEKVYTFKKPFKPREIVHENTRFKKGRVQIKIHTMMATEHKVGCVFRMLVITFLPMRNSDALHRNSYLTI